MFKVTKDNKIIGVSEQEPVLLDNYEVEEDTEHTTADFVQVNGEFVLTSSAEAIEQKKEEIRAVRNQYLTDTDIFMIPDFPITDEQREEYKAYRVYLRDYPETRGRWWEKNPMSFNEWKQEAEEPEEQAEPLERTEQQEDANEYR